MGRFLQYFPWNFRRQKLSADSSDLCMIFKKVPLVDFDDKCIGKIYHCPPWNWRQVKPLKTGGWKSLLSFGGIRPLFGGKLLAGYVGFSEGNPSKMTWIVQKGSWWKFDGPTRLWRKKHIFLGLSQMLQSDGNMFTYISPKMFIMFHQR